MEYLQRAPMRQFQSTTFLRTGLSDRQSLHVRVLPGNLIRFQLREHNFLGTRYGVERTVTPEMLNYYYESCGVALALLLDELQRQIGGYRV